MRWPLQFIKLLTFLDLEQDFKIACRISICLRWNVRLFYFIFLKCIRHIITHVKLFWKVLGLLFIDTFLGFWQAFQFWKWTSLKSQLSSPASSIHYYLVPKKILFLHIWPINLALRQYCSSTSTRVTIIKIGHLSHS